MRRAAVAVPVVLVLTGCGSLGPDEAGASRTAADFHAAVAAGDGAAACALLAPETAAEVAESTGQDCGEGIVAGDLPAAGETEQVDAYGRAARVVLDGDVVFLGVFGAGWKVTAAGCSRRSGKPYDCAVQGG